MISQETSSEMDISVIEKNNDNFSWSVQLTTIEMTLKVQNFAARLRLVFEHVDVISMIGKGIDHGKL